MGVTTVYVVSRPLTVHDLGLSHRRNLNERIFNQNLPSSSIQFNLVVLRNPEHDHSARGKESQVGLLCLTMSRNTLFSFWKRFPHTFLANTMNRMAYFHMLFTVNSHWWHMSASACISTSVTIQEGSVSHAILDMAPSKCITYKVRCYDLIRWQISCTA